VTLQGPAFRPAFCFSVSVLGRLCCGLFIVAAAEKQEEDATLKGGAAKPSKNKRAPKGLPTRRGREYNVCGCSQEAFMAAEKILTLRLEGKLRGRLDKLAVAMRRSRSFLAAEAIREYVALNSWQIEEIQKGMGEADGGEFASESEVKRVTKKWARRAR
jgi:RHH-type rel operon transcriptional repressor/antitoxin RelB